MATLLVPVRSFTVDAAEGCSTNVFAAPGFWDLDTNGLASLTGAGQDSAVPAGMFTEGGGLNGTWDRTSVAGPTTGIGGGGVFVSYPLAADVTISGQITFVVQASESGTGGNATLDCLVFKMDAATGALTLIIESAFGTELTTSLLQKTWNGTPGAGVDCKKGDRLLIIGGYDDATAVTMGAGITLTGWSDENSSAGGNDGFTFTETLTFDNATPAGTTWYLQDAASDLAGSGQKALGRVRGDGMNTSVTNTAAGPTAGIQLTDTAGGTALEWFTPQLQAFSLTGKVAFNVWCKASNTAAKATLRAEVAVVDSDGTGAVTIGTALVAFRSGSSTTQLDTTIRAAVSTMGVATTDVTEGQRLRLRLFIDENYLGTATFPLVTGHTATIDYDHTAGGADGDSFITLTETVLDFTPLDPVAPGRIAGIGAI